MKHDPHKPLDRFPVGTDGWRGIIADGCTFPAVRRIASAVGEAHRSSPRGDTSRIVVGHDTRFYSPEFARAVSQSLAAAGLDVLLTDRPIPTPAVSFHVKRLGLAGGVAITASHNPARYNGFKIKSHFGSSAPPEVYAEIDRCARAGSSLAAADHPGRIDTTDLATSYRQGLAGLVDLKQMQRAGLTVLADAMHGAASTLASEVMQGGSTRVLAFRSERDVLFGGIHPEPIAANLGATSRQVREQGCDLAVAFDGDADRLGVLDRQGRFVSPHRVLALLLLHAFGRRGLSGGIAKTFSTSLLIDRVAQKLGVTLHETPIGFKYIAGLMNSGQAVAGGEESGGYAFAFHLPERDGVANALLLIESLAMSRRNLDQALAALAADFGEFGYARRDVYLPVEVIARHLERVASDPPSRVAGETVSEVRDKDGIKYLFDGRGWLLHRLSGTEPMVRLYCEHEDPAAVERILSDAAARLNDFARTQGAEARATL